MEKLFNTGEHGFSGILCRGDRSPDRAVIYVPGAGSTREESIHAADFIKEAGFSVLVLGYYGWEGTPEKMEDIPVEYALSAASYLKETEGCSKVIMAGASEGAVYSMLCASLTSRIDAVCAAVPMDFVMASPRSSGNVRSVYTKDGAPLPFAPFPLSKHGNVMALLKRALSDKEYGMRRIIRCACDMAEPSEEAFIKVEDMDADLLVIVPGHDDIWASEQAAARIEARLKRNGYRRSFRTVTLEGGSHFMGGSYDLSGPGMKLFRWALIKAEHDHPEECDRARERCFALMLDFFENC